MALIPADLFVLKINDNYPNVCPRVNVFTTIPSIYTYTYPFYIKKKQFPESPWWKT